MTENDFKTAMAIRNSNIAILRARIRALAHKDKVNSPFLWVSNDDLNWMIHKHMNSDKATDTFVILRMVVNIIGSDLARVISFKRVRMFYKIFRKWVQTIRLRP
jgi:hypothetical protein